MFLTNALITPTSPRKYKQAATNIIVKMISNPKNILTQDDVRGEKWTVWAEIPTPKHPDEMPFGTKQFENGKYYMWILMLSSSEYKPGTCILTRDGRMDIGSEYYGYVITAINNRVQNQSYKKSESEQKIIQTLNALKKHTHSK